MHNFNYDADMWKPGITPAYVKRPATCPECGGEYLRTEAQQKTCSAECREVRRQRMAVKDAARLRARRKAAKG